MNRMLQVVLVVAQDLRMSPGKVAAQCAHAAVGLFKLMQASRAPWLHAWEVRSMLSFSLKATSAIITASCEGARA